MVSGGYAEVNSSAPEFVLNNDDLRLAASAPDSRLPIPASAPRPSERAPQSNYRITKVHHVRNDETYRSGPNGALAFEKKYWNYGAITKAEQRARRGDYYVISWANTSAPRDLVTRFEYRQVSSKDTVRTLEISHPHASGANRSVFSITGDAFETYGPVSSWRFTVLSEGTVVAQETSFIW